MINCIAPACFEMHENGNSSDSGMGFIVAGGSSGDDDVLVYLCDYSQRFMLCGLMVFFFFTAVITYDISLSKLQAV